MRHNHIAVFPVLAAVATVTLAFASSDASAQARKPSDVAAAQSLFDEAKGLMTKGDFADACPKLEESERLDPGAGTEFHLADCYEHAGRTASAWAQFSALADSLRASGQGSRADVANQRAAALQPRLVKLAIVVPQPARVPGLSVQRDNETVGQAQWGSAVSVDPGPHVVSATATGVQPWQSTVDVEGEGKTTSVQVPVLSASAAPTTGATPPTTATPPQPTTTAPPPSEPAPSAASPGHTQRLAGIIIGGVGVAGLVAGGIFGIEAFSKHSDYGSHCNAQGACDPTGIQLHDSASSAATLSTIFVGVGAAALVGGAILFFTAPKASSTAQAFQAAPMVGPGTAGMMLRGAW